jgi:NADPH2:quinone reductase
MKAILISEHGSPEVMRWQEQPLPEPAPHQIRLKMLATSVNFADLKARRAPYRQFKAPFIPGFDGVGVVEKVGEEIRDISVGMRVAAYTETGSYAEYALTRPNLCFPWEAPLALEEGIGIGTLITAYNALTLAGRMQEGERVLIHAGAGGVGSIAIQIARKLGAAKIFTTIRRAEKAPFCKKMGADHTLVLEQDDLHTALQQHTAQANLDLILDTRGGKNFAVGLEHLAPFGRVVIFGHSASTPGEFQTPPLHRHNQAIIGYSSGGYRKARPAFFHRCGLEALAFFKQHQLHIPIGSQFSLRDAAQAHALVEANQHQGKVLLSVD